MQNTEEKQQSFWETTKKHGRLLLSSLKTGALQALDPTKIKNVLTLAGAFTALCSIKGLAGISNELDILLNSGFYKVSISELVKEVNKKEKLIERGNILNEIQEQLSMIEGYDTSNMTKINMTGLNELKEGYGVPLENINTFEKAKNFKKEELLKGSTEYSEPYAFYTLLLACSTIVATGSFVLNTINNTAKEYKKQLSNELSNQVQQNNENNNRKKKKTKKKEKEINNTNQNDLNEIPALSKAERRKERSLNLLLK